MAGLVDIAVWHLAAGRVVVLEGEHIQEGGRSHHQEEACILIEREEGNSRDYI